MSGYGHSCADQTKADILSAATKLFARKSYGETGVREIASEAGVSVSMINYHFGCKQGILKDIIQQGWEEADRIRKDALQSPGTLDDRIRRFARGMTDRIRENSDFFRIIHGHMVDSMPELAAITADHIRRSANDFVELIVKESHDISGRSPVPTSLIGPIIMGTVMVHFHARPVARTVFGEVYDEDFYRDYPDHIADMLLYGLIGRKPDALPDTGAHEVIAETDTEDDGQRDTAY